MFSNKFNKYLKERNCSAKKFSEITKISAPTISRYKTGKTVPSLESGNIEIIAKALSELPGSETGRDEIYEDLLVAAYEDLELVDYTVFSKKLSLLISRLNINQSKLADAIPISSSHLSKICHGQIKPRNPVWIAESVANYVTYNYSDEKHYAIICDLIWKNDADKHNFSSSEECFQQVRKWLLIGESLKSIMVDNLLHQHGEYDITHYLPYPKTSADLETVTDSAVNNSQLFVGTEGLIDAFFSWVKIACNSRIDDEIFIYDEILVELAEDDIQITSEYADSVEKIIKKGKQVTYVNNLHDDLYLASNRMLLWLPLTMSRRVDNYYLNEPKDKLYKNMIMISSDAVLIGSVTNNDYANGYYTLIRSASDIAIARKRAAAILSRANQSNRIFDTRKDFENDLVKHLMDLKANDSLHLYLPAPPLSTMSEDLLRRILTRNNISPDMTAHIVERFYKERHVRDTLINYQHLDVTLNCIDYADWHNEPVYVAFNDRSSDLMLTYNYDEYREHIELTKELVREHSNIELHLEELNFYENMLVIFIPGRYAALTSLRKIPVDASSEQRIIVDSFAELIRIMTPSNYPEIMKNEHEKKLLEFVKKFMQRGS